MEGLLRELHYFEPKVMPLRVKGDYARVFGQSIVQCVPIEFLRRGADELDLDFNNSKLEIMLKITLENGNDLNDGDCLSFYYKT